MNSFNLGIAVFDFGLGILFSVCYFMNYNYVSYLFAGLMFFFAGLNVWIGLK